MGEVRRRRALPILALLIACPLLGRAAGPSDPPRPVVNVGLVFDGPPIPGGSFADLRVPEALGAIRESIETLTRREFDVRFPEDKILRADWTPGGIGRALDALLADDEVQVVMLPSVLSTSMVARRESYPKPVVALFGVDIESQGLPYDPATMSSGVHNLYYVARPHTLDRDIRTFRDLVGFRRLHIVLDPLVNDVIPDLSAHVAAEAAEVGIEAIPVPAFRSADEALDALPADAEAVYITPLLRMPLAEYDRLIRELNARHLPTFSLFGKSEVELGVLAGVAPKTNTELLARFVALNVRRILRGEEPGSLRVLLDQPARLVINMETARTIGWYPTWNVLTRAELINEEVSGIETRITLDGAVRTALDANLDLRAEARAVEAGARDIDLARAPLLPRLELDASEVRIDDDRAAASSGNQAERTASAGLALTQLLWSEASLANLRIQKDLQTTRELGRDALALDVAADAATAFLDLLRAQTLERIQKDNVQLTEENLDIARRRQNLGVSGPADVYRWESQLATDRIEVIDASSRVDAARAALNRLLHRPLEQALKAVPTSLDEPYLFTAGGRLDPYIGNPWAFEVFRGFMVQEGLARSPELRALDAGIAAEERALLSARRSFWSPSLALRGELTERLDEGGPGQDPPLGFPIVPADDTDWSVALTLSLPLSTGGERLARARQSRANLDALHLEREAVAERIELRVRAALYDAGSSFPAIDLSAEAAAAARKNYQLVEDTYSQGLVSIIDLLDAQNAALVAEQGAANSVFDFLVDMMKVQRATADFDFFFSAESREDWFRRLDAFFSEVGGPAGPYGR